MAEEIENKTAGDTVDGREVTDGSPGQGEVQDVRVVEERGAENTEVEGNAVTVDPGEEVAGTDGTEAGSASASAGEGIEGEPEETTESVGEAAEEVSGEEGAEEKVEEGEAGLVSSEELRGETEEDVTDEEWVVWKKEFINRFQKRFDKKWMLPGIGIFVVLLVIAGFFAVPGLRFADTGEVKSLEEIAGPVCDMKFFLPLSVDSGKKRFVKVTVAIELVDKGYKKEIDKKVSEIREEVINLVLTKTPKEVKSSRGKEVLRKEITAGLNKYLAKDCVKNTYFTELIVL